MKHPVFFSFAGDSRAIAERLKSRFADDFVYMYTRTGVDGDSFPTEIRAELIQCELFVIFWSAGYAVSDPLRPWCRRELFTAAKRVAQKTLSRFLILQVDKTPLDKLLEDPDSGQVVDVLKPLRDDRRAFGYPLQERAIENRISSELAQMDRADHPLLPRFIFQQEIRKNLSTGNAQTRTPVLFVNGFHGSGRRTMVKSVIDVDFRHLTPYYVSLDSADGPEDFLRTIWGAVLQKTVSEQRLMMRDITANPSALLRYYSQIGPQLVQNRSVLIISKDESTDVSEVIPFWVTEFFAGFQPSVQPLAFFIVGRGLPEFMQRRLPRCAEISIPTLEDFESEQLVNMVVGAVDPHRVERWRPHIADILESGANSPKLLVDIVQVASRRASLDFLRRDAQAQAARFDERVQKAVEWAWNEVKNESFTVQVLDVINLLGVLHLESLNEIMEGEAGHVGEAVFRLVEVGLVEHLSESTYRVPRALARKLNIYMTGNVNRPKSNDLLRRFARSVPVGHDEFGGVLLTNRIQVQLATESPIDADDQVFVTAAMLFKAGWQRYRLGQYGAAVPLLRRAFGFIDRVRDESTKLEIIRFYGLSAGREHLEDDVAAACAYLVRAGNFHHRLDARVKAMELFIRGFSLKSNSQFQQALPFYEEALQVLPDGGHNDSQRAQMMNESVQCLLRIEPVDYARAIDLAERLCTLRETPNNLDVLLRTLLGQTYYDPTAGRDIIARNFVEMDRREALLQAKCAGSALSFFEFRVIDRLEAEAVEAVVGANLPYPGLDLTRVIARCERAYTQYRDDALLWRKWDLMLLTEVGRNWDALHREATRYLLQGGVNRMAKGNSARVRIMTFNLSDESEHRLAYVELEKYKADGTLPRSVVADIRRQLDAGDQRGARVLDKLVKRGLRAH